MKFPEQKLLISCRLAGIFGLTMDAAYANTLLAADRGTT
jgi:hypothetical protein